MSAKALYRSVFASYRIDVDPNRGHDCHDFVDEGRVIARIAPARGREAAEEDDEAIQPDAGLFGLTGCRPVGAASNRVVGASGIRFVGRIGIRLVAASGTLVVVVATGTRSALRHCGLDVLRSVKEGY